MAFCGFSLETKANLEGLDRFSASGKVTFFLFLTAVYVVSKLKKKRNCLENLNHLSGYSFFFIFF